MSTGKICRACLNSFSYMLYSLSVLFSKCNNYCVWQPSPIYVRQTMHVTAVNTNCVSKIESVNAPHYFEIISMYCCVYSNIHKQKKNYL